MSYSCFRSTFSGLLAVEFDGDVTVDEGCSLTVTGVSDLAGPPQQFVCKSDMTLGTHTGSATNMYVNKVEVAVTGTLTVDTQASINGDGRGYASGLGPGAGKSCTSACGGEGAGHGGLGGAGYQTSGLTAQYDSILFPREPGSGGGRTNNGVAPNGGGALVVLSDTLVLRGRLSMIGLSGVLTSSEGCCSLKRYLHSSISSQSPSLTTFSFPLDYWWRCGWINSRADARH